MNNAYFLRWTFTWETIVLKPPDGPPQWNMLHWGPRCNCSQVCWGTAGCEWGTTFVYFGITYVCFNSRIFLVFAVGPSSNFDFFYSCQKYLWNDENKIFKKIHEGLLLDWNILIKLKTSFIRFFCHFDVLLGVTYANMLVAIQWPRNRAPHLEGLWNMEAWKLIAAICGMGDMKKISFQLALNMTMVTWGYIVSILLILMKINSLSIRVNPVALSYIQGTRYRIITFPSTWHISSRIYRRFFLRISHRSSFPALSVRYLFRTWNTLHSMSYITRS